MLQQFYLLRSLAQLQRLLTLALIESDALVQLQHLYVAHFLHREESLLLVQVHQDLGLHCELLLPLQLRNVSVLGPEIECRGIFREGLRVSRSFLVLELKVDFQKQIAHRVILRDGELFRVRLQLQICERVARFHRQLQHRGS